MLVLVIYYYSTGFEMSRNRYSFSWSKISMSKLVYKKESWR
jgi:hypothetical protein